MQTFVLKATFFLLIILSEFFGEHLCSMMDDLETDPGEDTSAAEVK